MSNPNLPRDVDNEIQNEPAPVLAVNRQESLTQQSHSSTDQSQSAKVQPAEDADKIEPISSPSPKEGPPRADLPSSLSSQFKSLTVTCGDVSRKSGIAASSFAVFILGVLLHAFLAFWRISHHELHMVALSLVSWAFFTHFVKRGKWAKRPALPIEEGRRHGYEDVPSLNEGNPMEPPCPRPQQESPKERVCHADVHQADQLTNQSDPSTSSPPPRGCDLPGPSGLSTPSTSGVVKADVHVPSQTSKEKEDSESDS